MKSNVSFSVTPKPMQVYPWIGVFQGLKSAHAVRIGMSLTSRLSMARSLSRTNCNKPLRRN